MDEGTLSRLRAHWFAVRRWPSGAELQLGDVMLLGSGEYRSGGHHRRSILADTLEAVLGAIFLDGEFAAAAALF